MTLSCHPKSHEHQLQARCSQLYSVGSAINRAPTPPHSNKVPGSTDAGFLQPPAQPWAHIRPEHNRARPRYDKHIEALNEVAN
ncbi:hypothetical protein SKAU_G00259140 [Synaphobranchus kaupii]|uniref:Uncharacterized protein n=1 Tax=Synaphobranchus kaupii TaxID=118154 RepID=A0A9Q1F4I7_SYNKA|nr:hypothetical protein SKAU_G00259140 [Synaphobranchus kaupii]